MKLDQEAACKLYNLINEGASVGVGNDNEVITDTTALGTALNVLGKPTYIPRARRPDGSVVERTLPNGVTYKDPYFWEYKEVAAFLREWADAMDPPPPHEEPTC